DSLAPVTGENRWIGGLHQALKRQRIRFLEVVWSASGASALQNLLVRRRTAIYANAAGAYQPIAAPHTGFKDPPVQRDSTTEFLIRLAENVLIPAAKASVHRIRRYERLLRLMKPRGVLCMERIFRGSPERTQRFHSAGIRGDCRDFAPVDAAFEPTEPPRR